jgi:hypothetical protein
MSNRCFNLSRLYFKNKLGGQSFEGCQSLIIFPIWTWKSFTLILIRWVILRNGPNRKPLVKKYINRWRLFVQREPHERPLLRTDISNCFSANNYTFFAHKLIVNGEKSITFQWLVDLFLSNTTICLVTSWHSIYNDGVDLVAKSFLFRVWNCTAAAHLHEWVGKIPDRN